jgi:RimJ/RimL family protein N-acetyltransferase
MKYDRSGTFPGVLTPIVELRTARMCLRPPVQADARRIYEAYGQDPVVSRYLAWRPYTRPEQAEPRMRQRLEDLESGRELSWVVADADDSDRLLGLVSLFPADHHAELGYVLARPHWGRGLMPEAAGAVLDWALAQPGVFRVWAVTDVENRASARVLEKIGMELEGVLRRFGVHPNLSEEPRDCLLYARVV